jgi:hypothetical protein
VVFASRSAAQTAYMIRMTEIVELAGEPQTFALLNSRDMLRKLIWEIEELRSTPAYPNGQRIAYRAFNSAITAWSLVDWVWGDLDVAQRSTIGNGNCPSVLGKYCTEKSTDLEICESIANSSKHRKRLPRLFNPSVRTKMVAPVRCFRVGDPVGQPLRTWTWEAIILHHGKEYRALDVFLGASTFWSDLLNYYSIPSG